MSNKLSSVLALVLASVTVTACAVDAADEDTWPDLDRHPGALDDFAPKSDPMTGVVSPLIFDAPVAAPAPSDLGPLTFHDRDRLRDLVVFEQPFTTTSPIRVHVGLVTAPVVTVASAVAPEAPAEVVSSAWNTWVLDEETGAAVPGCTPEDGGVACELRGGRAYRVVTSTRVPARVLTAALAVSEIEVAITGDGVAHLGSLAAHTWPARR